MNAPAARSRPPKTTARRWIVPDLIPAEGLTVIHGPSAADLSLVALDLASAAVSGRPFAGEPDETRSAAAWRVVLFGEHFRRNSGGEGIGPRAVALSRSRPDYDEDAIGARVDVARHPVAFTEEPGPGEYAVEEFAAIMAERRPAGKGAPEIVAAVVAVPEPLDSRTVAMLRAAAERHALAVVMLASGEAAAGAIHHGEDDPRARVDSVLEIRATADDRGELRARGRTIARYRVEVGQIEYHSPTGEPNTAAAWVEWER